MKSNKMMYVHMGEGREVQEKKYGLCLSLFTSNSPYK